MVRGKERRARRGGGRHFSAKMANYREEGTGKAPSGVPDDKKSKSGSEEEDSEESGSGEEEEDSEESGSGSGSEEESSKEEAATSTQPELSRAERRDQKKKKQEKPAEGEDEDPYLINPNHVQKMNISDLNTPREPSRRDIERQEKKAATERYWKLHLLGQTDQARADLKRLEEIRKNRDAAQAKRKAETAAKAEEVKARKKAQLAKRPT